MWNHTGLVSGGERSMLELVTGLRDRGVDVVVASPDGPLREHLQARGIAHHAARGTTASFKVSAAGYARAATDIARSARAVRGLARELGADLVHANSIRSGLVAGFGSLAGGPPVVVHARDTLAGGPVGAVVRGGLRSADLVIAISEHVAGSLRLPRDGGPAQPGRPAPLRPGGRRRPRAARGARHRRRAAAGRDRADHAVEGAGRRDPRAGDGARGATRTRGW